MSITERCDQVLFDPIVAATLMAVALTPFYFLHPAGINLGPADFIFGIITVILVFADGQILFSSSHRVGFGELLFLFGIALSLFVTPRPVEGILDFLQYVLIFASVVPVTMTVLDSRRHRWFALLLLWLGLNFVTVAAVHRSVIITITSVPTLKALKHMELLYGNQNRLYWLIGAAAIINIVFVLDNHVPQLMRYVSALWFFPAVSLVLVGRSLSAILMVATAGWLAVLFYLEQKHSLTALNLFFGLTVTAVTMTLALVMTHWEYFLWLGNVNERLYMYKVAVRLGTHALPLGTGLESSPVVLAPFSKLEVYSIHNFALAYYLEAGILGFVGILSIVWFWARDIATAHLRHLSEVRLYETGPMLVFVGYLVVSLFQNVPVQRFWWVMFALSCSTALGISQSGNV